MFCSTFKLFGIKTFHGAINGKQNIDTIGYLFNINIRPDGLVNSVGVSVLRTMKVWLFQGAIRYPGSPIYMPISGSVPLSVPQQT